MTKLLAGIVAALLVGVGVAAASSLSASDDPVPTGSTLDSTASSGTTESTGTTETTRTTQTGEDLSGPCDEAEHANDPRCTGAAPAGRTTTGDDDRRDHGVREPGEDVRGPCDEAEHANDPRCTGAAEAGDRDDDRRGGNSGPGGGHDDDDRDDHSGRGGGDDDDDRSGSNSGRG
jgi:hypothetical protein